MLKQYFVKQGIKEVELQEFIMSEFPAGDYSKIVLNRTPMGLKIVIYTNKPGRIIGRGGKNIDAITDALKTRFDFKNPQIDIKMVENADLDPRLVSKQIASALERGYNYKKIANISLKRIMDAGALGTEISISGALGGNKSRRVKFLEGYLKHCGESARELVDIGFYEAQVKRGKIGVKVKIMKEFRDITGQLKDIKQFRADKLPKELVEKIIEEPGSEILEIEDQEKVEKKPPKKESKKPAKKAAAKK